MRIIKSSITNENISDDAFKVLCIILKNIKKDSRIVKVCYEDINFVPKNNIRKCFIELASEGYIDVGITLIQKLESIDNYYLPIVINNKGDIEIGETVFNDIIEMDRSDIQKVHPSVYVAVDYTNGSGKKLHDLVLQYNLKAEKFTKPKRKNTETNNEVLIYDFVNAVQKIYRFNISFSVDDVHIIPKYTSGIYVFADEKLNIMYIGKAKNLNARVRSHINGLTHTKNFCDKFKYVSLLYLNDYDKTADIVEPDLVSMLNPKYNVIYNVS